MKGVDLYLQVRRAVRIEGLSERAAARRFEIDPRTMGKMMKFSVPLGYVRQRARKIRDKARQAGILLFHAYTQPEQSDGQTGPRTSNLFATVRCYSFLLAKLSERQRFSNARVRACSSVYVYIRNICWRLCWHGDAPVLVSERCTREANMLLSDVARRTAKPTATIKKLSDGWGLQLASTLSRR